MRLQAFAGAVALAGSSYALSDSLPWVLLSTSALPESSKSPQIQTSSQVLDLTKDILTSCPTDRYLLVSQPGVKATDLRGVDDCALPRLCQAAEDSRIQGKLVVPEVIGEPSQAGLSEYIKSACSRKGKEAIVDEFTLSPLARNRAGTFAENDNVLGQGLEAMTSTGSYTILFFGTPQEQAYEPEFDASAHMDLKRNFQGNPMRRADGEVDNRPLFEKYQFFTPGIFMGLFVAIILFTILGVGISGLSSLEVSYGAFDKDMAPTAQKKQQ